MTYKIRFLQVDIKNLMAIMNFTALIVGQAFVVLFTY